MSTKMTLGEIDLLTLDCDARPVQYGMLYSPTDALFISGGSWGIEEIRTWSEWMEIKKIHPFKEFEMLEAVEVLMPETRYSPPVEATTVFKVLSKFEQEVLNVLTQGGRGLIQDYSAEMHKVYLEAGDAPLDVAFKVQLIAGEQGAVAGTVEITFSLGKIKGKTGLIQAYTLPFSQEKK